MPKVSIIMPAYNCEMFIEKAIKSVLEQTYKDWELIIIDDCSTDETLRIIDRLKTEQLYIIKNTKTLGPGLSRNKAIEKSKRKIYCFY